MLGAVAYDPKVVTIWDGFQRWFAEHGLAFDYVLYSNYERQVEEHFAGALRRRVELAAGLDRRPSASPRARGRTAEAIAMRDTDRDLTSVVVVRADSGIAQRSPTCAARRSASAPATRRRRR